MLVESCDTETHSGKIVDRFNNYALRHSSFFSNWAKTAICCDRIWYCHRLFGCKCLLCPNADVTNKKKERQTRQKGGKYRKGADEALAKKEIKERPTEKEKTGGMQHRNLPALAKIDKRDLVPCPATAWPCDLPPCPTKRIGLTDPFTPHASHPARFQQLQQQRTAEAVYNPNDPGGEASLMTIAAREEARKRYFTSVSQSCTSGLNSILVTVNSTQANAARIRQPNENTPELNYESVTFSIALESPMTELLAHRLVYGQVRSWEVDLALRAAANPDRVLPIIDAPSNAEPIFGEDRYTLPISELYDITCARQTFRVESSGNVNSLAVDLPLTLTQIVRIVAFQFPEDALSKCLQGENADTGEVLPLYAFRTKEPHGFVPGLAFYLVIPDADERKRAFYIESPSSVLLPKNADRFVVIDTLSHESHNSGVGHDCFEFVALRCKRETPKKARQFDPWDGGVEPQKYGWPGPRIVAPLPPRAIEFLRHGDPKLDALNAATEGEEEEKDSDSEGTEEEADQEQEILLKLDLGDEFAFVYVPPATTPQQLVVLVNGTLRAQMCCGFNIFDRLGIEVTYDALIDQYFIINNRGTRQPTRSLLGEQCETATTLNFPLSRKAMVASETSSGLRQRYLRKVLQGFYYFNVVQNHNDRFQVAFECGTKSEQEWRGVVLQPGFYAARFFVEVLKQALQEAFDYMPEDTFEVTYEIYDTERLVEARFSSAAKKDSFPAQLMGPYQNLTWAITIRTTKKQLFRLRFDIDDRSRRFASLIDFDPAERYELRSTYTSRPLSAFGPASPPKKCIVDCAPCPRRVYDARVDDATGLVSIEQRIQRPFRVCKVEDANEGAEEFGSENYALRVVVLGAASPPVMFCAGDVLLASKTDPLCSLGSKIEGGGEESVLVVIVGENSYNEFDLSFDPFFDTKEFYLWSMPVGFNLHLHRNNPATSTLNYFDTEQSGVITSVAESNPVTRFLGFVVPYTRSGLFVYTSDQVPSTVIDETILLQVKEFVELAGGQGRNTLYTPQTPFNSKMVVYYAQLLIDRTVGQYRAFPALTNALPQPSVPLDVLPSPGGSQQSPEKLTVQLYRPDGSPYLVNGNSFTLTFELVFVRK